jgi:TPR repeat protein
VACRSGDADACHRLGGILDALGMLCTKQRVEAVKQACEGGYGDDCFELGPLHHLECPPEYREDAPAQVMQGRCWGTAVKGPSQAPSEELLAALERACEGGHEAGCWVFAEVLAQLGRLAENEHSWRPACESGELARCRQLGLMLMVGAERRDEAATLLSRACTGGDEKSCGPLVRRLKQSGDPSGAEAMGRRGCDGGDIPRCRRLAKLRKESGDAAGADGPLLRACLAGTREQEWDCEQLADSVEDTPRLTYVIEQVR